MNPILLAIALLIQEPGPRLQDDPTWEPAPAVTPPEAMPRDLWYGTPGVRPGGDLFEPLIDLVRRPSNLLDFTPRKVKPFVPDRETMEFLRHDW